jgi:hypothetical protein
MLRISNLLLGRGAITLPYLASLLFWIAHLPTPVAVAAIQVLREEGCPGKAGASLFSDLRSAEIPL